MVDRGTYPGKSKSNSPFLIFLKIVICCRRWSICDFVNPETTLKLCLGAFAPSPFPAAPDGPAGEDLPSIVTADWTADETRAGPL